MHFSQRSWLLFTSYVPYLTHNQTTDPVYFLRFTFFSFSAQKNLPRKKKSILLYSTLINRIQSTREYFWLGGQCEIIPVNWIVKSITLLISESFWRLEELQPRCTYRYPLHRNKNIRAKSGKRPLFLYSDLVVPSADAFSAFCLLSSSASVFWCEDLQSSIRRQRLAAHSQV